MIDDNHNGLLSWDEIHEICVSSLQVFNTGVNDNFVEQLSKFFTDYIFMKCGYNIKIFKNKGVPLDDHIVDYEDEGEAKTSVNLLSTKLKIQILK
mmetsp:Transcript_25067/g.38903  ORF Transcript_25067/g.38903 Transcript_25067/m.38903 type:complete len:95 (+) Transcript_25067:426-710(+)